MPKPKHILENRIVLSLLLIPFFEPAIIEDLAPSIHLACLALKCISCVVSVFLLFRNYKITLLLVIVFVLQTYLVFITFINEGDWQSPFKATLSIVCIFILITAIMQQSPMKLIEALCMIFGVFLFVSFASVLIAPEGLYFVNSGTASTHNVNDVRYIFGHKNLVTTTLIPGLLAFGIYSIIKNSAGANKAFYVYGTCLAIQAVIIDSKNSLVVVALAILMFYLIRHNRLLIKKPVNWFAGVIGLDIAVTVLRLHSILEPVLLRLGRDLTFTGRTAIWDRAMRVISQNPLFGFGFEYAAVTRERFGSFTTAHNLYFTTLYYGGVIALGLLIASIVVALRKLSMFSNQISSFIKMFILLICCMGIFESMGIGLTNLIVPLAFAESIDSLSSSFCNSKQS